jgi:hypothetical protein
MKFLMYMYTENMLNEIVLILEYMVAQKFRYLSEIKIKTKTVLGG